MNAHPTPIPPMSVAFSKILDLGQRLGVRDIKSLPGAWECRVDDSWIFAVNGKKEPIECRPEGTMGAELKPFTAAVWYNGWLAALMSPFEGVFLNGSEDDFIASVERRIEGEPK